MFVTGRMLLVFWFLLGRNRVGATKKAKRNKRLVTETTRTAYLVDAEYATACFACCDVFTSA